MQDRKGKKVGKKGALKVVARSQKAALRACFSEGGFLTTDEVAACSPP